MGSHSYGIEQETGAGAKYLIAEGDTYTKSPDDETYPQLDVNYVKLDKLPKFSDGWLGRFTRVSVWGLLSATA